MRSCAKTLLRSLGVIAWRSATVPVGADLPTDLRRLGLLPNTIFDIGANLGQMAEKFSRSFPTASIFSFEPFPAAYAMLACRNVPRVKSFQLAMGSAPGQVEAPEAPGSGMNSLLPGLSSGPTRTVAVTTVDRFCAAEGIDRIDLLKTDTEGYELEVLKGAEHMLSRGRIRAVLVEASFEGDGRHVHFCDLFALLQQHRLKFVAGYDICLNERGWHFGNVLFMGPRGCAE